MSKDWHRQEFRTMVALGESTTAGGWSTSPDRCWVSVLGALVNDFQSAPMRVVNSGIGSNVISTRSPCYEHSGKPAGDERLDKHVLAHRPDLLIISYGLNDALGGTPVDLFGDLLVDLVRRGREHIEPVIVLPGPHYMTDFRLETPWGHGSLPLLKRFNEAIGQIAIERRCLYVDVLGANGETCHRRSESVVNRPG